MNILDAIQTRASVGIHGSEVPTRAQIERIIAAAQWAPNHRLTEPWRFTVFTGDERKALGDAQASASGLDDPVKIERQAAKPLRAPVVIVVHSVPGRDDEETKENRYAVAAAVQNLLLAAHAEGLGAIWRTGSAIYSDEVARLVGAESGDDIIAAVYVGYATGPEKKRTRRPVDEITNWRESV